MSNSIFPVPSLPNGSRGWPIDVTVRFNTLIETPISNRGETRISTTPYAVWDYTMTFPLVKGTFNDSTSYLNQVVGFYMQMQGQANSWLFNDPVDNAISAGSPATFGLGDGSTTVFQLTRPIGNAADIIQNVNGTPTLYKNGTSITSGYTIDTLGVVTFNTAPANGSVLAWSGSFYKRCRFSEDTLELSNFFTQMYSIQTFKWQTVIL